MSDDIRHDFHVELDERNFICRFRCPLTLSTRACFHETYSIWTFLPKIHYLLKQGRHSKYHLILEAITSNEPCGLLVSNYMTHFMGMQTKIDNHTFTYMALF
jgi:hypothetical protein